MKKILAFLLTLTLILSSISLCNADPMYKYIKTDDNDINRIVALPEDGSDIKIIEYNVKTYINGQIITYTDLYLTPEEAIIYSDNLEVTTAESSFYTALGLLPGSGPFSSICAFIIGVTKEQLADDIMTVALQASQSNAECVFIRMQRIYNTKQNFSNVIASPQVMQTKSIQAAPGGFTVSSYR